MDIADKDRLTKLIGMLGSQHAGERDNAAVFIQKMATKYKLTITELLAKANGQTRPPPPPPPPPPPKQPQQPPRQGPVWSNVGSGDKHLKALRAIVDNEEKFEFAINAWEWEFTEDVANRYSSDDELTDKQIAIIERIVRKCSRSI